MLWIYFGSLVALAFLLVALGYLGPKRFREWLRKLNRWFVCESAPIFPVEPYEPISESAKSGIRQFFPSKKRLRNSLRLVMFVLLFVVFAMAISLMLVAMSGG